MKCPYDGSTLVIADSEGHVAFVCGKCDGHWLPLAYIKSIKYWKTWFSETDFALKLHEATRRETILSCPANCGHLSTAAYHSVEVDWCPRCHGVWFDKGELRKVLEVNKPKSKGGGWDETDIISPLIDALLGS